MSSSKKEMEMKPEYGVPDPVSKYQKKEISEDLFSSYKSSN